MSKSGFYQQQHLKADVGIVGIVAANTKTVDIKLSNIREIAATIIADGSIAPDRYKALDDTAIKLALIQGATVTVNVETESGDVLYQVISARKDGKKYVMTAKAIGVQPARGTIAIALFNVNVDVTTYDFDLCDTVYWSWFCDNPFLKDTKSQYIPATGSDSAELVIENTLDRFPRIGDLFAIEGKIAGFSNVETMVGIINGVCMDGKKTKLRLSKKGLKSKGCAAKKAVAGFKEGVYKIQSMYPVVQVEGPGQRTLPWKSIQTLNGVLRKTAQAGTFNLVFNVDSSSRVYNFDSNTKTVSSIKVNDYIEKVIKGTAKGGDILVQLTSPSEKNILSRSLDHPLPGLLSKLSWSVVGYNGTVKISLHHAAKLAEKTVIEKFSI
jgi:hypothetical protein